LVLVLDASLDPLVALIDLIPRPKAWIAKACRAGRIPNAIRVGKVWFIRRSDYDRWTTGTATSTSAPTVEDAAADLRRRGVQ
jgi:hypothetical protein